MRSALRRLSLVAVLLALVGWGAATSAVAQSPQITSERPCSSDSDCPVHPDCWFRWWPGCGCDEGAGRCDPNPQACDSADGCFGQEFCSQQSRCEEPGPPERAPCNADSECASWMSCLEGRCSRGNCVDDADCENDFACDRNQCLRVACSRDTDCRGGQVCRDGGCVDVQCVSDAECTSQSICSGGRCQAVECRNAGQCPSCSLCDATHRCVSLCRDGEECFGFPSAQEGQFIVQQCRSRSSLLCTASTMCPVGQHCLGGTCVDLKGLMRDIGVLEREQR